MKLTVDSLPSHFKPYTFKSFRMDAINFDQSQKLGAKPSIEDCRAIIGELTHGEIDVAQLVPLDIKYLIATHQYNLEEAIEATAEKIVEHPETLAWS